MEAEKELTAREKEELVQVWVKHYEGKLPRLENYKRKSIPHLRKLHGKLLHYTGAFRNILAKWPEDRISAELVRMYERHLDAARENLIRKTAGTAA